MTTEPTPAQAGAAWRLLGAFEAPQAGDREARAAELLAAAVRGLDLPPADWERLRAAVARAVQNAGERDVLIRAFVLRAPAAAGEEARRAAQGWGSFVIGGAPEGGGEARLSIEAFLYPEGGGEGEGYL